MTARRLQPLRFAVGTRGGLSSNTWRVFVTKKGDAYVRCKDNFTQLTLSLHVSGRWRVGFTQEAVASFPWLAPAGGNRALEVWDEPQETLPRTVTAFRLLFPTSELAVRPDQRTNGAWRETRFIEPAPEGKIVCVSVFLSQGSTSPRHESEWSEPLGSFEVGGRFLHVVAHHDPELDLPGIMDRSVLKAWASSTAHGVDIPPTAFSYCHGRHPDGARFFLGARVMRASVQAATHHLVCRVKARAYFLWKDRVGQNWMDPESNWFEALAAERRLLVMPQGPEAESNV